MVHVPQKENAPGGSLQRIFRTFGAIIPNDVTLATTGKTNDSPQDGTTLFTIGQAG